MAENLNAEMVKGIVTYGEFLLSNTLHYHLHGIVCGHETIPDGHQIMTSRVLKLGITSDGKYIVVVTKNSIYLAELDSMHYDPDYLGEIMCEINGVDNEVGTYLN